MSLTRTALLTAAAAIAALTMTGGAFAKTFEAVYTVNIHKTASKGSKVVDKLFEGERVTVKACDDNDWCLIDHDGPDGWVPVASLERLGGDSAGPTIIVQGGFATPHKPKPLHIIVDPVHPPKGPVGIIDTPRPPPKHKTPVVLGTINHGSGTPTAGGHCIVGQPCTISN